MGIKNPGLAFNKLVFKRLGANRLNYKNDTKSLHESLFQLPFDDCESGVLDIKDDFEGDERIFGSIDLKVLWPGILMGLGLGHGAKTEASERDHPHMIEVKNGFSFDFTTGLPVLPGSTVKGILRSFFPGRYKSKIQNEAIEQRLIKIIKDSLQLDWTPKQVSILEDTIFDGKIMKDGKKAFLSSTESDIFLEAILISGEKANYLNGNVAERREGLFLGEDTLTPHAHPLKNPIPIKILKVLPGVTFKFQFLLNNEGELDAKQKLKLFNYILLNFGAGARKGVGFGQFENPTNVSTEGNNYINFKELASKEWGITSGTRTGGVPNPLPPRPTYFKDFKGKIKKDQQLIAKVIDVGKQMVEVSINGKVENYKLTGGKCPANDSLITVSMNTAKIKDKLRIIDLKLVSIYKQD
ncbi:MAG: type III-B CRISPR module RAMP protein Cmr6 [Saprospiraceae bacterium]|nr:type III-B CRISPR module RAMP protein Cmr6 [Candidatus Vicinibacter affinis]